MRFAFRGKGLILKLPTEGLLSPPPPGRHKTHPERASPDDMTATKLFFFPRALTPSGPGRRVGRRAGGVSFGLCGTARPEATTLPPTMTNKALYSAAATTADGRMMGQLADDDVRCPLLRCPYPFSSEYYPICISICFTLSCWII